MLINDAPLSRYGLEPVTSDGRVGFATGSLIVTEVPETSGVQLIDKEFDRPRRMTIPVRLRGDTIAGFGNNRKRIADLLQGALEVRFSDMEGLALRCMFESLNASGGPNPEWQSENRPFELVLVATNPFFADRFTGQVPNGPIPVGTAPTEIITEIGGPLTTDTTLKLADMRGNTVAQLKYTGTLSAGEWLVIEHVRSLVRKFTAVGTAANAYSDIDETVSDFGFFFIDPDLGNRDQGLYPEISTVAGDPTSIVHKIRRNWH